MLNVGLSQSVNHPTPQQHIINNRTVQDQGSASSSITYSDTCINRSLLLSHCIPIPSTNGVIINQSSSSNINNSTTQCPMFNHPCYITNCHHQSIPLNLRPYHQRAATFNNLYNSTSNMNHLQLNHQQCQDNQNQNVTPIESENDNGFTLVKRKKEKEKKLILHKIKHLHRVLHHQQFPRIDPLFQQTPTVLLLMFNREAQQYAETRYAFPPFIIKFQQDINGSSVIKYIVTHYSYNYNFNLHFAGHRLKHKRDLLLFVNDRESLSMLYDAAKWPLTIESLNYEKTLPNHLSPQFSLVLKHVPFDIETDTLLTNIKNTYTDVMNAHRIFNKSQQPTALVRLDINNVNVIDELFDKKFLYIDNLRLRVMEYLAPAKVLICGKCYQIGHFRSTCKSTLEYCNTCGFNSNDLNRHKEKYDKKQCCIRCKGSHDSNDVSCPDVKTYRVALANLF
ncbi:unnamed protein product [Rotaria sp. Silwood2]|nr:unnamed protein product [Rotaria sp. Silwood2]